MLVSRLPLVSRSLLRVQIWHASNPSNMPNFTLDSFTIALRLIALAQNGKDKTFLRQSVPGASLDSYRQCHSV
jgi:hypothetical protein